MGVVDLLNPNPAKEAALHKKKRLIQAPNSCFYDIRCPTCGQMSDVFSHSTTAVKCGNPGCMTILVKPTGGKARFTEGCQYRIKPQ